jgi:helicase
MIAPFHKKQVYELSLRMKHGIKKELLPLVKFRNIGRVRARRLYNNNMRTVSDLKKAGFDKVSLVVGEKNAESIFDEILRSEGEGQNGSSTGVYGDETLKEEVKGKEVSQRSKKSVKKTGNEKNGGPEEVPQVSDGRKNSGGADKNSGKKEGKAGKNAKNNGSTQSTLFSF